MRVSIVLPIRDEELHAVQCLDSLLAQTASANILEILCIDGRSVDRTRDIVTQYTQRDPRVQLLDNPSQIVPTAMNIGILRARGDIIMRIDCHAHYAQDYVERCLQVMQQYDADNVGGYIETLPARDTSVARAIAAATSHRFGVGGSAFRTGGPEQDVDTVPFGCFRRSVFERFGLYDERLIRNQDIELNTRIRRGGGRVVISPRIQVSYFNRATFAALWQQAFVTGQWNPYTAYLVGHGLSLRHFVPLAFVTSILLLGLLSVLWPPVLALLGAELALYAGAAFFAAAHAARSRRAFPPLVAAAFFLLHFAYGTGSFCGLLTAPFRFGLRPRRDTRPPTHLRPVREDRS